MPLVVDRFVNVFKMFVEVAERHGVDVFDRLVPLISKVLEKSTLETSIAAFYGALGRRFVRETVTYLW